MVVSKRIKNIEEVEALVGRKFILNKEVEKEPTLENERCDDDQCDIILDKSIEVNIENEKIKIDELDRIKKSKEENYAVEETKDIVGSEDKNFFQKEEKEQIESKRIEVKIDKIKANFSCVEEIKEGKNIDESRTEQISKDSKTGLSDNIVNKKQENNQIKNFDEKSKIATILSEKPNELHTRHIVEDTKIKLKENNQEKKQQNNYIKKDLEQLENISEISIKKEQKMPENCLILYTDYFECVPEVKSQVKEYEEDQLIYNVSYLTYLEGSYMVRLLRKKGYIPFKKKGRETSIRVFIENVKEKDILDGYLLNVRRHLYYLFENSILSGC